MSRNTNNSKKEHTSSDLDDDNLTRIHEEELPEVSGHSSPHENPPFSFYLDPGIADQVEQFTPLQEIFLKTLLETSTKHLIQAHSQAVQTQQEEMVRLQRRMQDMQEKIGTSSNRMLTSMETPRAIWPQDVGGEHHFWPPGLPVIRG